VTNKFSLSWNLTPFRPRFTIVVIPTNHANHVHHALPKLTFGHESIDFCVLFAYRCRTIAGP
jgi:hypothetical protein